MADELSIVLHSLAEYFNYFAVVLILLCSFMMTIFIIRAFFDRHGEHLRLYRGGPGQGTSSLAFQRPMAEFCNPFFLRLATSTGSNFSDGLHLDASCLEPSDVMVFWGAPINILHVALLQTGVTFVDDLRSGRLLQTDSLVTDKHRLESAGKHKFHLPVPPEFKPEQLGAPPRQRYPCVVIMLAANGLGPEDQQNRVVAMVTVIHIKDGQCRMDTHIMAQYAKLAGTAVYNLQPLFFATEFDHDINNTASEPSRPLNSQNTENRQQPSASASQGAHASEDSPGGTGDYKYLRKKDEAPESVGSQLHHRRVHADGRSLKTEECDATKQDTPAEGSGEREARSEKLDSKPDTSLIKKTESEERGRDQIHACTGAMSDLASNDGQMETSENCGGANANSDTESDMLHSNAECSMPDLNLPNSLLSQSTNNLPDCIVCQNRQLTCVLLPCRHACVCRSCFQQLDRCPMCRSHIESFFTLTESDDEDDNGDDERNEERPMDWGERWERLNERLNQFFGFN